MKLGRYIYFSLKDNFFIIFVSIPLKNKGDYGVWRHLLDHLSLWIFFLTIYFYYIYLYFTLVIIPCHLILVSELIIALLSCGLFIISAPSACLWILVLLMIHPLHQVCYSSCTLLLMHAHLHVSFSSFMFLIMTPFTMPAPHFELILCAPFIMWLLSMHAPYIYWYI